MLQQPYCDITMNPETGVLQLVQINDPMNIDSPVVVSLVVMGNNGKPVAKLDIPYTLELAIRLYNDPDLFNQTLLPALQSTLENCCREHGMSERQAQEYLSGKTLMGRELIGIRDLLDGEAEVNSTVASGIHPMPNQSQSGDGVNMPPDEEIQSVEVKPGAQQNTAGQEMEGQNPAPETMSASAGSGNPQEAQGMMRDTQPATGGNARTPAPIMNRRVNS